MKLITDVAYGTHPRQKLDWYLPDSTGFPLMVYIHGGGLEGGRKEEMTAAGTQLAEAGIGFVSVEYRLYPDAKYPEFIEDAAQAVAWVKAHRAEYGAGNALYVGGSSAGGYLSMMLCFDPQWLAPYGIDPADITGWIHDAGQPTTHFNVLRERGVDTRRLIVDEAAPLYHIGTAKRLAPMLFIVSDNDMENRLEQTTLVLSTLKHFRYDESRIQLKVMHGGHCHYVVIPKEDGTNAFADIVQEYITK